MSEEKTYVFGEGSANSIVSALAPMLSNRGIDPGVLALMNNNDGFGNGGWWIWVIFLAMMWGGWGGRGGFGGYDNGTGFLASQLNNDYGRDVLLQAINGNANAIGQLATTLHCDVNQIQSTLCSISNTVGLTGQQIINAVQSGNSAIASQIASCCCDVKGLVTTQGYENRLATLDQTATLAGKIDAQTTLINDKFCQLEMREMQNKIDTLREEKSTLQGQLSQEHQSLALMQNQSAVVSPLANSIADISNRLAKIECNTPEMVKVPYTPVTAIPNCVAAQYGLYNGGFGFGPFFNNWG